MRLRNRFLLVGFGVVLFLLTTPILVLYARGFKIDWETRQIIKTGTLVVNSEPTRAEIYLNDEKLDSTTNANVRFLLPGDYIVRIEKEGYQSWTKRLTVRSQLVTWANLFRDYITLFLKQPIENTSVHPQDVTNLLTPKAPSDPEEIRQILENLNIEIPEFQTIEIIRNDNQIYLVLDSTLYLINDTLEKIYSPVTEAFWDKDSQSLLYANNNEIYIYHSERKTSDLILRSVTTIQNPLLNIETGYVFYQNEGKIKAIELDDRDHRNIFTITDALDQFTVSKDGKTLHVVGPDTIKSYKIR